MSPVAQNVRSRPPWTLIAAAWSAVLLIGCYASVLRPLIAQWSNDEDMGHGFFVPLVAGYIAWQKRDLLRKLDPSPSWWGLAIMAWGALQLYIATVGAELFLSRTAFVISAAGVMVFLLGWQYLRVLAFPVVLLFFKVPIPAVIYNNITFPLQLVASRAAESALQLMSIPVLRRGNILELPQQTLSVVEACSGIRSLLSLSFLSLVYGYFFESKPWVRAALFAATVPIAIAANAGRVTLAGLLSEFRPELVEGFFHSASGWVIFMVAMALLVALHQLLNKAWEAIRGRR